MTVALHKIIKSQ